MSQVVKLAKWLVFEEWLFENSERWESGEKLTQAKVVEEMGLSRSQASSIIQAYLKEQRDPHSKALFHFRREGRTSSTEWLITETPRARDARETGKLLFADVEVMVNRAYLPDLDHIALLNPWARRQVAIQIEACTRGWLVQLAAVMGTAMATVDDER